MMRRISPFHFRVVARLMSGTLGLLCLAGCYASHSVGEEDSGIARDVSVRDVSAPDVSLPDVSVPATCGCPGREVACSLPEMCCPVTRTCENPSTFRCSGTSVDCD